MRQAPWYSLRTVWHHRAMHTSLTPNLDTRHQFPGEISRHCVWLTYRFSLSSCDVAERMVDSRAHMAEREQSPLLTV